MQQPEFGKKIAERRVQLGFTQEDLAEKCEITVRSIQRIEAGKVNPRRSTFLKLIDILDFEKGVYYKEKVEDLRGFYEHLSVFLIVNFFIYLRDILDGSTDFVVHKISIIWGIFILLHTVDILFEIFLGSEWEEKRIKKLMSKLNLYAYAKKKIHKKTSLFKFPALVYSSVIAGIIVFWYLFIGYHNHCILINKKAISISIKSAASKFEFSVPGRRAKLNNEYAINAYNIASTFGRPFNINGHGIISSRQTINLPDSVSIYRFTVNNHGFTLEGNNLYQGTNMWYVLPNEPLKINADLLD